MADQTPNTEPGTSEGDAAQAEPADAGAAVATLERPPGQPEGEQSGGETRDAEGDAQEAEGTGDEGGGEAPALDLESLLADSERFRQLTEHPRLREEFEKRENAGKQRAIHEARLKAGDDQFADRQLKRLIAQRDELMDSGESTEAVDHSIRSVLGMNRLSNIVSIARTIATDALEAIEADDTQKAAIEATVEALAEGADSFEAVQKLSGYVEQLRDLAVEAGVKKATADLSLADVPAGSKLYGEIEEKAHQLAEAEIEAARRDGRMPDVPPRGPDGTPTTPGKHDMTTRLGLSRAYRAGEFGDPDSSAAEAEFRKRWSALSA